MVSYNVIVGDTITTVLIRVTGLDPNSIFAQREFVIFVTAVCITLPLSLYRYDHTHTRRNVCNSLKRF